VSIGRNASFARLFLPSGEGFSIKAGSRVIMRRQFPKKGAAERWLKLSLYVLRKRDKRKAKCFNPKPTEAKTGAGIQMLNRMLFSRPADSFCRS
jgi:hypothetical protein